MECMRAQSRPWFISGSLESVQWNVCVHSLDPGIYQDLWSLCNGMYVCTD